jgi:hypothetical protein
MMDTNYQFLCPLTAEDASKRIEDLLLKEGIKYRAANLRVTSTSTPIALFGFQPVLYSRRNWVGLNPFVFVSGVDVRCWPNKDGSSRITVQVDRRRAVLMWAVFWILCAFPVAGALPRLVGAAFFVFATGAVWLIHVSFLGGYLVKKEIRDYLTKR